MNKLVYLGLSILEISHWYNARLCYMDTDSFIIYIKTEDVYEDIADSVEKS